MPTRSHIRSSIAIEQQLDLLADELRVTLALLHGADDQLAELTLATLPMGSRAVLVACGAITAQPTDSDDAAVSVTLTPAGRELITACAVVGLPPEVAEDLSALEQARARREHSGPAKTRDLLDSRA